MMAYIRVIAVALALASTTAWSSHPFESSRNQYEVREDSPQPLQMPDEATDPPPLTPAPDLQIGCGEGHIHEKIHDSDKNTIAKKKSSRLVNSKTRRRRSFAPSSWSGQVIYASPYQSINVWRPPVYQLNRPYYIPVYGIPGKRPLFYPSQPLLLNPGAPKDNPRKPPFTAPTYLPPVETSMMNIGNRFNGGDNYDDRPVWDMQVQPSTTTTPRPTRRPARPSVAATAPPLIHNPNDVNSRPTAGKEAQPPRPPQQNIPPLQQNRPSAPARPNEPSRCVWAIISCCSTAGEVSYDCFDQRGCPGAFWDNSPCESEFAKAAISAALNFYGSK